MKKILLILALGLFGLSAAQYYPSGSANDQYESGWYGDDDHYFSDDYYYDYPDDYYVDDYYRSFYNDYRQSITRVNWNRLFRELRLNAWQANMIMELNNQFPNYYTWNSYYRSNPNRWYYDRFYALEQILGSRAFALYQNYYYNGISPVRYYVNYWRSNYRPRYYSHYVVPRYRQININVYKVNRRDYHRQVGNKYGWNQPRNSNNASFRSNSNSTLRNSASVSSTSNSSRRDGFKSSNEASRSRTSGLRPGAKVQQQRMPVTQERTNSGLRNSSSRTVSQNRSSSKSAAAPRSVRTVRQSGTRTASNSNKQASSHKTSSSRVSGMRGSR